MFPGSGAFLERLQCLKFKLPTHPRVHPCVWCYVVVVFSFGWLEGKVGWHCCCCNTFTATSLHFRRRFYSQAAHGAPGPASSLCPLLAAI